MGIKNIQVGQYYVVETMSPFGEPYQEVALVMEVQQSLKGGPTIHVKLFGNRSTDQIVDGKLLTPAGHGHPFTFVRKVKVGK